MNIQLKTQGVAAARPLAGKVSLVTGSTSGIGLGIACALAEAGSAVVLNGLGPAADIARTKDQLAADFGVQVSYSAADMTSPEAIAEMIAATVAGRSASPRRVQTRAAHATARTARSHVQRREECSSEDLGRAAQAMRMVSGYSSTEWNNAGASSALKIPPRTPPTARQR